MINNLTGLSVMLRCWHVQTSVNSHGSPQALHQMKLQTIFGMHKELRATTLAAQTSMHTQETLDHQLKNPTVS